MQRSQLRTIVAGTTLGALLGFIIGVVVVLSRKEQFEALESGDANVVKPGMRDWIGLTVTVVTLLRQIANLLAPPTQS